jgi:hypothetical protein
LNPVISFFNKFELILILLVLAGTTGFLVYPDSFRHQNNLVKADFYNSNEDWDRVITTIFADRDYDIKFNYLYNRAITNKDQYLDKYFDYPQLIGASGTFPDKLNYELLYLYYSDYYYDLGYIAESQQWGFKALSGFPFCPMILKRLVKTNLILKNYSIAGKLLEILDDNLLSKSFVDHYTPYVNDTTLMLADKALMTKRSYAPSNLITPTDVTDRFLDLLAKNSENKRAFEHLEMNFLLNHQLGSFYKYLPMYSSYYKTMPLVFEEALLIIKSKDPQMGKEYPISQSGMKLYLGFSNIYRKYGGNKETAKPMLSAYKNTLFYFTIFDSPVVTKKVPVKANSNEYNL